jgi:hypothetical protein
MEIQILIEQCGKRGKVPVRPSEWASKMKGRLSGLSAPTKRFLGVTQVGQPNAGKTNDKPRQRLCPADAIAINSRLTK